MTMTTSRNATRPQCTWALALRVPRLDEMDSRERHALACALESLIDQVRAVPTTDRVRVEIR